MKTLEAQSYYLQIKKLAPSTQIGVRLTMKYLNEMFPELPDSSGQLDIFIKSLSETRHLADYSIKIHILRLKAVYHLLKRKFKLDIDFLAELETYHYKATERRYFNAEELARIIAQCQTPRDLAMLYTFIDSPMRASELTHMKVSDITIYQDEQGIERAKVSVNGKTGFHSMRIDPQIARMNISLSESPDGYVFRKLHTPSEPMAYMTVYYHIHKLMIKAGFTGERLSPHTLRHSSASLVMLMSKGNVSLVDALIGHKQGSKASATYLHNYQESLAQSISPIQLVKDQFKINHPAATTEKQFLLSNESNNIDNSKSLTVSNNDPSDNTPDILIQSMFPTADNNTTIRPSLNNNDIDIIRRAFVCLTQFGQILTDGKDCQALYNRILRKAKTTNQDLGSNEIKFNNFDKDTFLIK